MAGRPAGRAGPLAAAAAARPGGVGAAQGPRGPGRAAARPGRGGAGGGGEEPYAPSVGRTASRVANLPAAIALARAELARRRGDADRIGAFARQALAQLTEADRALRLQVDWDLAVADWFSGRLERAEQALAGVVAGQRAAGVGYLAVRHAQGDPPAALGVLAEADRVAESSPAGVGLLDPVPPLRARLALAQGEVADAARRARARGLAPGDQPSYPREPGYLVLARVLLAEQACGDALALLERLGGLAAAQRRTGILIEVRVLQALALAAGTSPPAGWLHHLRGQFRLATPTGGLVEPLSDRELEVLGLLAAGRSNREIAEELVVVVALDTVKKHVSHVLGKLGAANRTQAVTCARELRLLD